MNCTFENRTAASALIDREIRELGKKILALGATHQPYLCSFSHFLFLNPQNTSPDNRILNIKILNYILWCSLWFAAYQELFLFFKSTRKSWSPQHQDHKCIPSTNQKDKIINKKGFFFFFTLKKGINANN